MNFLKGMLVCSFILGVGVLSDILPVKTSNETIIENPKNESAVVVELFTSQGCSSCPAADKVLSKIIDQSEQSDLPIYGLSFHVDYWNRLGWKDPYSKREYTERQYSYAKKVRASSVYTPQMIVNGKSEFVGSKGKIARETIAKALTQENQTTIKAERLSITNRNVKIEYNTQHNSGKLLLNIALVERGLFDNVTRGENKGRKLTHDNVVRSFKTQGLSNTGIVNVDVPKSVNTNNSTIVLYVQDSESFQIFSATKVDLE